MNWLYPLILAILEALLKVLVHEAQKPSTATVARRDPSRRERLLKRVREARSRHSPPG